MMAPERKILYFKPSEFICIFQCFSTINHIFFQMPLTCKNNFLGITLTNILKQYSGRRQVMLLEDMKISDRIGDYREARFHSSSEGKVRCGLCPHNCQITEGQMGLCRSRVNIQGKLYALSYGNLCAISPDPIEKKPLYHFLPGSQAFSIATAGCNFSCLNCQNHHISQFSPAEITAISLSAEEVVKRCLMEKCNTIAYTYTEPTVFYEYMYDVAMYARQNGIRNVMISNGYINPGPLKKLAPLIDAANIDLKVFDEETYRTLSGGALKPVLNTLRILKDYGVWIEITHLIVPSYSANLDMIKRMCEWLVNNEFSEFPLHFSRFFPNFRLQHIEPTPLTTLKQAWEIAVQTGLHYVYLGNITDETYSHTYCPDCKKLLIKRQGYRVTQMLITDGKCPNCGTTINGVWN